MWYKYVIVINNKKIVKIQKKQQLILMLRYKM